jgi:hypothetical protein
MLGVGTQRKSSSKSSIYDDVRNLVFAVSSDEIMKKKEYENTSNIEIFSSVIYQLGILNPGVQDTI